MKPVLLLWSLIAFLLYAMARMHFRFSRTAWHWPTFRRQAWTAIAFRVWLGIGGLLIVIYVTYWGVTTGGWLWRLVDRLP